MTLLRLSPLALSRSRFALSPLAETVGAAISLSRPCTDPWLSTWHEQQRHSFAGLLRTDPFARGLTDLLSTTKWLPDVVAVPPRGGMRTTLRSEVAQISAVPDAEVRRALELAVKHSWTKRDLRWLQGRDWGPRIAAVLTRIWTEHVAPDWARRRTLLEREVMYRAGLLAAYGWPRALKNMSRRSEWIGADSIRFSSHHGPDRHIGSNGLQFVPVSLSGGSWLCESSSGDFALVYPARGAGMSAEETDTRALDRVVGEGRARIMRELCRPATATELAQTLELALGTVGGHLKVLRGAGLIIGGRVGHRVIYRLTRTGELLLAAAGHNAVGPAA